MKSLGFGRGLYIQTRDALQAEWDRLPSERRTWAHGMRLHTFRIISRDPSDVAGILSDTQALKLFLTRLENKLQSGETLP